MREEKEENENGNKTSDDKNQELGKGENEKGENKRK